MKQIELYASGWAVGNKSGQWRAGVGVVFDKNGQREHTISRRIGDATSHSVFLSALIIGLQDLSEPSVVTIYCHNQVVAKCANGAYGRNSNLEMWKDYDIAAERHEVTVVWIRKDSHEHNTLSSKLAKQAVSYYE